MTITSDDVKDALREFKEASDKLDSIKQAYAEQECPFAIGEIIAISYRRNSSARIKVSNITYPKYAMGGSWIINGRIIKGDGNPGLRTAELSQWKYESSRTANEDTHS